jgi:hypothetical protein
MDDVNIEFFRQLIFVASIIAGFSFTGALQLLARDDPRSRVSVVIGCFLATSLMGIVSTILGSMTLLERMDSAPTFDQATLANLTVTSFLLGLALFLGGLGGAGWIRSTAVGLFSSGLFLVPACVLIALLATLVLNL